VVLQTYRNIIPILLSISSIPADSGDLTRQFDAATTGRNNAIGIFYLLDPV